MSSPLIFTCFHPTYPKAGLHLRTLGVGPLTRYTYSLLCCLETGIARVFTPDINVMHSTHGVSLGWLPGVTFLWFITKHGTGADGTAKSGLPFRAFAEEAVGGKYKKYWPSPQTNGPLLMSSFLWRGYSFCCCPTATYEVFSIGKMWIQDALFFLAWSSLPRRSNIVLFVGKLAGNYGRGYAAAYGAPL